MTSSTSNNFYLLACSMAALRGGSTLARRAAHNCSNWALQGRESAWCYQAAQRPQPSAPQWEQPPVPVHLTGDIQVIHEALNIEWKVRCIRTHQLLELFTFLIQSQQRSGILFYIQFVFCPEFFREVIYQSLIKVPTTYERVKGSGQDLAEVKEQVQQLIDKVCSVSFTQCSKTCHHHLPHGFRWHLVPETGPAIRRWQTK